MSDKNRKERTILESVSTALTEPVVLATRKARDIFRIHRFRRTIPSNLVRIGSMVEKNKHADERTDITGLN